MKKITDLDIYVSDDCKFYKKDGTKLSYLQVAGASAKNWLDVLEHGEPDNQEFIPLPTKKDYKIHPGTGLLKRGDEFVNLSRIESKPLSFWKKAVSQGLTHLMPVSERPAGNWKQGTNFRYSLEVDSGMLYDHEKNRLYKKNEWRSKFTQTEIGFEYFARPLPPTELMTEQDLYWFTCERSQIEVNPVENKTWCFKTGKYISLKPLDFLKRCITEAHILPLMSPKINYIKCVLDFGETFETKNFKYINPTTFIIGYTHNIQISGVFAKDGLDSWLQYIEVFLGDEIMPTVLIPNAETHKKVKTIYDLVNNLRMQKGIIL